MQAKQSRSKSPVARHGDVEYLLARGNVLLASKLMQQMAVAAHARQIVLSRINIAQGNLRLAS